MTVPAAISIEEIWRGPLPDKEAIAQRLVRGLRCAPLGPFEEIHAGRWRRQFAGRGITFTRPDTAAPLIAQFIQLVRASRSLSTAGRTVWLEWFRGLEIDRDPNV